MFRWVMTGLQALVIVVLVPIVVPDGNGATQQSWKTLLLDPVKAWQFGYYLDPYRSLFQAGRRLIRNAEEPARLLMHTAKDGSLHVSNLPDAKGKAVKVVDSNADLLAPTRIQGALTLGVCWLLVLFPLQWFKDWRTAYRGPGPQQQQPLREKLAEFIPYTVDSRITRPLRDITPAEDEPRSERQADEELRRSSVHVAPEKEAGTKRHLLR